MGSDQEAQAAIQGLNGQEHDGRPLTVNEARPREAARAAAADGADMAGAAATAAAADAAADAIDARTAGCHWLCQCPGFMEDPSCRG